MNKLAALVLACAACAVPAAHAQPGAATPAAAPSASPETAANIAAASEAARRWLSLMDAGRSVEAWDAGAPVLQAAVARATWGDVGKSVRAPLGEVKSRRETSSVFTRSLPGAPEGDYVVIQYATDFAARPGVIETVVPMRQPDGSWKVTTYRIR